MFHFYLYIIFRIQSTSSLNQQHHLIAPPPPTQVKDGGDENEEAEPGEDAVPEPKNKKEFYKLRAESNKTVLVDKCLQDRTLQMRLRMISEVGRYLHYEYNRGLQAMKGGPPDMSQYSANRSLYSWYRDEIVPLLSCLHDRSLLTKLNFTMDLDEGVPFTYQAKWFLEERDLARLLKTFVLNLAKEEVWTHLMFSLTLPHCLAALLTTDVDQKQERLLYLQRFGQALGAAEQQVRSMPKTNSVLGSFLASALFTKQQFSREILCVGNCLGWDLHNQELVDTAKAMTQGSSTTADCLEKCFAHLQDVARLLKAPKMENYHLWFSASSSPYTATGGMGQPETSAADYMNSVRDFGAMRAEVDKTLQMKKCLRLLLME